MKVPFIVYAPFILGENRVVSEAVSNIDVFPTLAELCHLNGMPVTDGISIAPLLKGVPGYTGRNIVFSRSSGDASGWLSATTDRYKLVISSSTNDLPWLIDKQTDPDELINFYNNPEYVAVKDTLKEKLIHYCEQNNEPKFKNSKIRADLGVPPLITDSSTTNLLKNGYFDLDGTSWSLSNTDILFESDPETEINGITCRLPGVNNTRSIKQIINVVPEISYQFSFKGRIQNVVGASESQVNNHETNGVATLKGEVLLPDKTALLTLSTQEPATQNLSGMFTVPSDVSSVTVSLSKNWNIAYLDEVSITDLTYAGSMKPVELSCMQLFKIDHGFRIKSNNPMQAASIFDITGKRIKYFFEPGFSLDVSPLRNGIYLTHVTFNERKPISLKYQVID
ncbi:hypothetical protein SDC9_128956 [bioreactor metagenome]|uniref:N-sulphoglucosamine sulphohydrolase C-terminal domain-containing protein n=1 Tax=bioreactor metagenome TaxID=1076179 RepID=A0A645CYA5_9ZZZZ